VARMVTLCLAKTMTVLAYGMGPYKDDENTLARPLLGLLRKGDLLVADRHFAGANLYARYLGEGLEFLTRAHQALNLSRLKPIIRYGTSDFVAFLKINRVHRKKDPTLPEGVMVRFIQVAVRTRGKRQLIWLATSLLDDRAYPAAEIAEVYGKRWRIETLLREIKIPLSADVLRSVSPQGVYKELAARIIAVNVVRTIILEGAIQNGVDPMQISFVHALRAIITFAPALASEPIWSLPVIYQAMLREIASHRVVQRPDRNEPRARRREPKNYPSLRITRKQWKLENVA